MSDFSTWFNSLPRFTKYWLALTVGISLLARFGILPMQYLMLYSQPLFHKFQVSSSKLHHIFISTLLYL